MWALIFIPIFAAVAAQNFTRNNELSMSRSELRMVGGQSIPNKDMSQLQFMAAVFALFPGDTEAIYMGNAVVMSKYWVISTMRVFYEWDPSMDATMLTVRAAVYDLKGPASQGYTRRVKRFVYDSANFVYSDYYINSLVCLRVCPSFPDSTFTKPYPSVVTPYKTPGTVINMYHYVQNPNYDNTPNTDNYPLQKATKKIAEKCECDDISLYNVAQHFCLEYNPAVHITDTFPEVLKSVVVTNEATTEIVGFVLYTQTDGAELMISLQAHKDWFTPIIQSTS